MEFTHIANPVRVTALVIRDVIKRDNLYLLTLDDGTEYNAFPEMTSRHIPQTGDYLVRQEDGYIYLNPKDVFERKYRLIGSQMTSEVRNNGDTELRSEALRQAINHVAGHPDNVVEAAHKFLSFLKGGAA